MEKELTFLGQALASPSRPFVSLLGGAKVSDKIEVIHNLLAKVDWLLVGGGMANTFLKAQGKAVGESLVENDKLDVAQSLLRDGGQKLVLPVDVLVADRLDAQAQTRSSVSMLFPLAGESSISGRRLLSFSHAIWAPRKPWFGMGLWASSRWSLSRRGRLPWPTCWHIWLTRPPSSEAVIPRQRLSEQALPNESRISRPAAVRRWSFSRARNYRASCA